ncbi:histidine phosphatase superfamily [Xylariaceae sp. FL0594]|nr:histidine phosphatase superfamily [Xylariaceae sp. FL0594]
MAPNSRIIICRHGQAEHNPVNDVKGDVNIPDALLTTIGKEQVAYLAHPSHELEQKIASASGLASPKNGPPQTHLLPKLQEEVQVIITSPLRRTLQTTLIGWKPAVERLGQKNVICLPDAQERRDFPCDTGASREDLEKNPEFEGSNFELLTPDWNGKKGKYSPKDEDMIERAKRVRQYLRGRPEEHILLVGHGECIRFIVGTPAGKDKTHWDNAEVRIFKFDPETVDKDECLLLEDAHVFPGFTDRKMPCQ